MFKTFVSLLSGHASNLKSEERKWSYYRQTVQQVQLYSNLAICVSYMFVNTGKIYVFCQPSGFVTTPSNSAHNNEFNVALKCILIT